MFDWRVGCAGVWEEGSVSAVIGFGYVGFVNDD